MSADKQVVQIPSSAGGMTPFTVDPSELDFVKNRITAAAKRMKEQPELVIDVTPIYWEAKRGEEKTLMFLGWKEIEKLDPVDGVKKRFMPIFHDGQRQVVMGQLTMVEAMFGKLEGEIYHITCVEATAGKAKKFEVKHITEAQ